jgi:hypothetical protein
MQARACSEHLNLRQFICCRRFQPLRQAWREGEAAAIGKIDNHPVELPVVARARRSGLGKTGRFATGEGGIDLVVSELSHESSPTG